LRNAISKFLGWKSEPEVTPAEPVPPPAAPKASEPLTLTSPDLSTGTPARRSGSAQTPAQALARRLATAATQTPEQPIRRPASSRNDPLKAAKASAAAVTEGARTDKVAAPAEPVPPPAAAAPPVVPAVQPAAPSDTGVDLAPLSALDGFIGAALVDSVRNTVLAAARGAQAFDLETAALAYGDVVRAKLAAVAALKLDDHIEDIVAVLGRQYHLVRPLAAHPGLFVYLVQNRAHANLALARAAMKAVAQA
jgi:hypothetical protein